MDEYISREAVFDEIRFQRELAESDGEASVVDTCDAMLHNLRKIETADVQTVKHGRWELITQNKFTGTKTLRCTYCKNYFVVRDDTLNAGRGDANFCPNCGSKNRMDGE